MVHDKIAYKFCTCSLRVYAHRAWETDGIVWLTGDFVERALRDSFSEITRQNDYNISNTLFGFNSYRYLDFPTDTIISTNHANHCDVDTVKKNHCTSHTSLFVWTHRRRAHSPRTQRRDHKTWNKLANSTTQPTTDPPTKCRKNSAL